MRFVFVVTLIAAVALGAFGCADYKVSRPYVGTMTRVDQKLEQGNRGYLLGTAPAPGERKATRQLITMDVDVSERVSDKPIDTFAGRPGVTKTAEPGDVVHANQAPGYSSMDAQAEDKVTEVKKEVTVVREETPTTINTTTVVTEEEIK